MGHINRVYRRAVHAIRAIDPDHIIFLEGDGFSSKFDGLDAPFADNLVYSSHNYTRAGWGPGAYPGVHREGYWDRAMVERMFAEAEGTRFSRQHGVPLWVGEFGSVFNGAPEDRSSRLRGMEDTLDVYDQYGAHWTSWTYKDIGVMGWVYADPRSEFIERTAGITAARRELSTDTWMYWLPATPAKSLLGELAGLILESAGEIGFDDKRIQGQLANVSLAGVAGGLMQLNFARAFKDCTETEIDRVLQSFAFKNCAVNSDLVSVIQKNLAVQPLCRNREVDMRRAILPGFLRSKPVRTSEYVRKPAVEKGKAPPAKPEMGRHLEKLVKRYPDLGLSVPAIQRTYQTLKSVFSQQGKLLICGNGGSAADSEHIVGELMKGFLSARPLPDAARERLETLFPENGAYLADRLQGALPAMSLASQTSFLTAYANDVDPEMVFAQQVYGYGRPGDAVLGISTSGNSKNVLYALQVGKALGLHTLGLTGRGANGLGRFCEATICVPADLSADIQERHMAIYHTLCAMLEQVFFPQMSLLAGIDIGGTKTAVCLGRTSGPEVNLLGKVRFATPAGPRKTMDSIRAALERLMLQNGSTRVQAIGVSCGGPLDSQDGLVLSPPNLPGWDRVDVRTPLEDHFGAPVGLQNDANACALAEWRWGAGRGCRNMIFLTFGTGMGAGLILDGKLYSGRRQPGWGGRAHPPGSRWAGRVRESRIFRGVLQRRRDRPPGSPAGAGAAGAGPRSALLPDGGRTGAGHGGDRGLGSPPGRPDCLEGVRDFWAVPWARDWRSWSTCSTRSGS